MPGDHVEVRLVGKAEEATPRIVEERHVQTPESAGVDPGG
jgi:hypothetical protein